MNGLLIEEEELDPIVIWGIKCGDFRKIPWSRYDRAALKKLSSRNTEMTKGFAAVLKLTRG